jgi:hypothetical protein
MKQENRMSLTLKEFGEDHKAFRKSNPTAKDVRAMNIKVVVAEPGWQQIRHDFIGTWKKTPEINVSRLRKWLGRYDDPIRVRQVLNYLTSSAFRIGVISHPSIDKLRDKVRIEWKKMLNDEG